MNRRRVRAMAMAVTAALSLLVGACGEAEGPQMEPPQVEAPPDTIPASATRADTLEWLAERTYADAQTTLYEDTIPACATCEIRLTPVGAFGTIDDRYLLRRVPIVERDSRGRFYATVREATDQELILYEPDGTVVRQVGRLGGEGPGEFSRAIGSILVGPGDSLYVTHDYDRLSVFDSSGVSARAVRLRSGVSFTPYLVRVDDEGYLVAYRSVLRGAVAPDSEIARNRLHLFAHDGRHLRSYGGLGMVDLRHLLRTNEPHFAGPTDAWATVGGSVWLGTALNYRLERINERGSVDRAVGVVPPDSWNLSVRMDLHEEGATIRIPFGRLLGFRQLSDRFGAAVLDIGSEDWENVDRRTQSDGRYEAGVHQELRDSVLDVMDLETGEVVARKRLTLPSYLMSDGTLYSVHEDEVTGVVSVRAYEIELVGWDDSTP